MDKHGAFAVDKHGAFLTTPGGGVVRSAMVQGSGTPLCRRSLGGEQKWPFAGVFLPGSQHTPCSYEQASTGEVNGAFQQGGGALRSFFFLHFGAFFVHFFPNFTTCAFFAYVFVLFCILLIFFIIFARVFELFGFFSSAFFCLFP